MTQNQEALRLPDPVLIRVYRAGMIDAVKTVEIDDQRNLTVHFTGIEKPARFQHLQDVGWVLEEPCGNL